MGRKQAHFNKKIFALLLEKARGERSIRSFANECGISYVQLHKLEKCAQENPPGKKLLLKLAENSENGIEYEDYLFAAGYDLDKEEKKEKQKKSADIQSKYDMLSAGQQKTVYDFVDYLLNYKK